MSSILNSPLIWIPVVGSILAILAFVGSRQSMGGVRIGLAVVGAVCLLVPAYLLVAAFAPELMDARYRTYKVLYRDIQRGMTRDQVLATVDKHYPAGGTRKRPKIMNDTAEELGFFMNPEHSREPDPLTPRLHSTPRANSTRPPQKQFPSSSVAFGWVRGCSGLRLSVLAPRFSLVVVTGLVRWNIEDHSVHPHERSP